MAGEDLIVKDAPVLSLHQRILDDIESRILSGEWPPGHRIPFEHELTEQYGCSRMTVNKALTQLAKAGLIERKRRSGSFVSFPQSQAAILEIHDIRDEVAALGAAYRFELTSRRERLSGPADARHIDMPRHTPLVELVCRHYAGKRVFALEERIISLDTVPTAAQTDFAENSPGPWLVSCVPWSSAKHSIRAIAATQENAGMLGIPLGAPCLVIERQTWNADQPVTHVRFTYPGDSHALVANFTPSQGG
ncbi:histidine utilization repressor [Brucella cytisi]|jgi:GntR family histidine utilization transcriptional repressor|uniref:Histidine utilization repressor n=1 Tax=Brucella cytisi TaxID=407152 RepID=A0A1J6HZ20_9HYPH|nr:histidine utilization repressor [Brucella cytisi]OIS91874.1 histidine utilization repressor [Brucella cytisi]